MITVREWITFGVVVVGALALVTSLLAGRAHAAGYSPKLVRRCIVIIWLCAITASGVGIAARHLMGGYVLDFSPGTHAFETTASKQWPAGVALVLICGLLAVAMRQVRILTAETPEQNNERAGDD